MASNEEVGGAILNSTAFTGENDLAKYLFGDSGKTKKMRHDKALVA